METLRWGDMVLGVDARQIYTFNGFDWSMGYKTESKDVKKKKPSVSAKAPNLEQINVTVKLVAMLGVDVKQEIGRWRTMCNKIAHFELSIGGELYGDAGSTWYIKSLKVAEVEWGPGMRMNAATLTISFEELPKKAKKKPPKKPAKQPSKKPAKQQPARKPPASGGSGKKDPITERYRENRITDNSGRNNRNGAQM